MRTIAAFANASAAPACLRTRARMRGCAILRIPDVYLLVQLVLFHPRAPRQRHDGSAGRKTARPRHPLACLAGILLTVAALPFFAASFLGVEVPPRHQPTTSWIRTGTRRSTTRIDSRNHEGSGSPDLDEIAGRRDRGNSRQASGASRFDAGSWTSTTRCRRSSTVSCTRRRGGGSSCAATRAKTSSSWCAAIP